MDPMGYRGCQSLHCLPQELNWPSYEHRNIAATIGRFRPVEDPQERTQPVVIPRPFEVPGRANSQLIKVLHLAKRLNSFCSAKAAKGNALWVELIPQETRHIFQLQDIFHGIKMA